MKTLIKNAQVVSIAIIVGCGPAFLPDPTNKPITTADLIGTWQYDVPK